MITTASLFCGAGGESAGRELAFEKLGIDTRLFTGLALNHWDLAVGVHGRNFPHVRVVQEDITAVTAADFGLSHIDLLWASPSCVHHSRARGGKPREEQQRSHAWQVVEHWLRVADVDVFLMENVPEFQEWGPLDDQNQPVKARKGEYFQAFVDELRGLGYEVEYRVLCAADYGDATTRRRLFLQAVKDGRGIHWPKQTRRDTREWADMFTIDLPAWKTAASCINFNWPCPSIFRRRKPLCDKTLATITHAAADLGISHGFFLFSYYGNATWQTVDRPLATVTTKDRHALVEMRGADIGMRMLEPHELAAAMGFPHDYQWLTPDGAPLTKRDRVKMIGNACPVNTVAELIRAVVMARGKFLEVAA